VLRSMHEKNANQGSKLIRLQCAHIVTHATALFQILKQPTSSYRLEAPTQSPKCLQVH
jgi:hypothetical protein